MHSLKNTIVAVGLLGLSFVFYQLSDPKTDDSPDVVAAELDAMLTDDLNPVEMPGLDMGKSPESSVNVKPAQLPPPSSKANKPGAALPAPKKTSPFPAAAKPAEKSGAAKVQPRPAAKFDFAGSPKPGEKAVKQPVSGGGFEPAVSPQKKRDKGLMAALDQQKKSTSNGGGFQVNAHLPSSQQLAPAKKVSTFQDSAVVGVSSVDAGGSTNNDFGMPAVNRDPYAKLSFREAWPVVDKLVAENDMRSALKLLTRFYRDSDLTGPQRQRLVAWLDGLAFKVIFTIEHHLHPEYVTREGDSLADLRQRWGVPGQLIYNVNKEAIPNPLSLAPGTKLKKITGPFHVRVDSKSGVMTAYVDGMYAGQFMTKIGNSGRPGPGAYKVLVKNEQGHEWKGQDGVFPAGHPGNQYGRFWIGLEGQLCIHAVSADRQTGHQGCLGLSNKEAKELFAMLSQGSTVTIE